MAEMFVSPLVSLLIENLAPVALSFVHSVRIDRKLKQWTDMLESIEAVLEDAEDRQLKEKPIQLWLHDVQKLAFENTENRKCLKYFPTGKKLPTSLRYLNVGDCENMEEPEKAMPLSLLELISLANWSNIKSLPQGLAHLTDLYTDGCSGIESIPETSLPPTLIRLSIFNCKNLKYILCANEMQSLTSLQELIITGCKNLEGYPSGGRWPPNLDTLIMGEVKQSITEWGLAILPTSLYLLRFDGEFPQLISFVEVGTHLPTPLTHLQIMSLENLESLGEGLENLSSLQQLLIINCPTLQELPETLFPTLSELNIRGCQYLTERRKKEKRDYWPKISHIPRVVKDDELMWGL